MKAQNEALKEAWANFKEIHGGIFGSSLKKEFDKFKKENSFWLDNDSLYEALSIENDNDFWYTWKNYHNIYDFFMFPRGWFR